MMIDVRYFVELFILSVYIILNLPKSPNYNIWSISILQRIDKGVNPIDLS
jgi:hypothetical protein